MTHIFILEDNILLQRRLVEIVSELSVCTRISYSSKIFDCKKMLLDGGVDILLADLKLPDGSGRECIKLFSKINPGGISIVMSALSDGNSIIGAIEDGAIGYLHKDDHFLKITDAIDMAMNGNSPMSPSIAYKVISRLQGSGGSNVRSKESVHLPGVLTPRELEVINMIAKGLSYSETAAALNISAKTVPVHIRNIYKKLQATNRSEAVFEARAAGIIE